MIRVTGNAGIGMQIGSSINLTDRGILGYAMVSSSTPGQAIPFCSQYGKSPIGSPLTLSMVEDPGSRAGESGLALLA